MPESTPALPKLIKEPASPEPCRAASMGEAWIRQKWQGKEHPPIGSAILKHVLGKLLGLLTLDRADSGPAQEKKELRESLGETRGRMLPLKARLRRRQYAGRLTFIPSSSRPSGKHPLDIALTSQNRYVHPCVRVVPCWRVVQFACAQRAGRTQTGSVFTRKGIP